MTSCACAQATQNWEYAIEFMLMSDRAQEAFQMAQVRRCAPSRTLADTVR